VSDLHQHTDDRVSSTKKNKNVAKFQRIARSYPPHPASDACSVGPTFIFSLTAHSLPPSPSLSCVSRPPQRPVGTPSRSFAICMCFPFAGALSAPPLRLHAAPCLKFCALVDPTCSSASRPTLQLRLPPTRAPTQPLPPTPCCSRLVARFPTGGGEPVRGSCSVIGGRDHRTETVDCSTLAASMKICGHLGRLDLIP
jgi:hypothetical protein